MTSFTIKTYHEIIHLNVGLHFFMLGIILRIYIEGVAIYRVNCIYVYTLSVYCDIYVHEQLAKIRNS